MAFQPFSSQPHKFITKSGCTNRKIRCIVCQRIEHFTISNSPAHHNICCRMCFREHIFNLFTRPNIPVWHTMIQHVLFPFWPFVCFSFCNNTFSYRFHNLKCSIRFKTFVNQISHNIISRTNTGRNGCFPFLNQSLRITEPYICTMR